ncbi:hypothetical protein KUTeg_000204 [Tegillarca granosa]|uniref:C2H2-type domain-containing protein n=1 Tax=Tegillarca granosa TaxID=220873 RepID=A0ABQ9G183_TEGGR|nr:hypothetical protein KUTeg_000204 [Tegillarca granosa]
MDNGDSDKKESHDQCEQANFDSDDDDSSKDSSPNSGVNTQKIKILGPASYKAAMRNKIQMNFPGARNRSLRPQDSSVLGYTNLNKGSSSQMLLRSSSSTQKNSTVTTTVPYGKKLSRCEHCCIWFEDYTMCLLHNSLHSADDSDPFTCRKCLKKLGNRLEFTAHLVWHLEPELDN